MIHLNGWMSLQCTKIHLTSRISLHAGCVMCRLQKEVDVNASQMIFNFSDVFKCWAFTVSLMRARLSCIYKIYVSPHNALRNRQLLPLPVDRQSALLHRALVTGDLCCADLFCGCNLTHIPSDSSLKMCQILCKNPLRHHGAAGGPLGTLCVCAPMCAVFQILLFCPQEDSLDCSTPGVGRSAGGRSTWCLSKCGFQPQLWVMGWQTRRIWDHDGRWGLQMAVL